MANNNKVASDSVHWIVPCNPNIFNAQGAFTELDSVYWHQSRPLHNIHTNDIVYIYVGGAVGRIVAKCIVGETQVPFSSKITKDKDFWNDGYSEDTDPTRVFIELFPIKINTEEALTLDELRQNGEKSHIQGPHRVCGDCLAYIEDFFSKLYIQDLLKGRNADFDGAERVKLVRHTLIDEEEWSAYKTMYDLYQDRERFHEYQNRQKEKFFRDVEYIVSFVATPNDRTMFIGVFRNNGCKQDTNGFDIYDFQEVSGFERLKEKTYVQWDVPRSWHRWYENRMEVIDAPDGRLDDHWFQQLSLNTKNRIRHTAETEMEYEAKHQKMQVAIKPILEREGYTGVVFERNHVDLQGTIKGSLHLFEVKTADTAKECIREALGQILEYAHYANLHNVDELYIIGPVVATDADKKYLNVLRSTYQMKLYYRAYLEKAGALEQRV